MSSSSSSSLGSSRASRYGVGVSRRSERPFERLSDTLAEERDPLPASSTGDRGDGGGGDAVFDTVIVTDGDGGVDLEGTRRRLASTNDDGKDDATHVLARSRLLSSCLAFCQGIFALATTFVLTSDPRVRTGWAHTYGAAMSLACAMEGLAHVAARAANRLSASLDVLSVVVCVASYAGVAGLATNTEDDAHGVPVDAIETATCLFALAWGLMTARIAACFVEREARNECTFELKFVSGGG